MGSTLDLARPHRKDGLSPIQCLDGIQNRPGRPQARFVHQTIGSLLNEPSAPLADTLPRDTEFSSHCPVGFTARTHQYDLSTQSECISRPTLVNGFVSASTPIYLSTRVLPVGVETRRNRAIPACPAPQENASRSRGPTVPSDHLRSRCLILSPPTSTDLDSIAGIVDCLARQTHLAHVDIAVLLNDLAILGGSTTQGVSGVRFGERLFSGVHRHRLLGFRGSAPMLEDFFDVGTQENPRVLRLPIMAYVWTATTRGYDDGERRAQEAIYDEIVQLAPGSWFCFSQKNTKVYRYERFKVGSRVLHNVREQGTTRWRTIREEEAEPPAQGGLADLRRSFGNLSWPRWRGGDGSRPQSADDGRHPLDIIFDAFTREFDR
jgi:hypothetical protein